MEEIRLPECTPNEGQRSCCALATALDVIGDRWSIIILRDMIFVGKQEFKEFMESPESIATNVLTNRLKTLSEAGIITKHKHPAGGKRTLYCLTDSGLALIPTLTELSLWSTQHLDNAFIPPVIQEQMLNHREAFISFLKDRAVANRIEG